VGAGVGAVEAQGGAAEVAPVTKGEEDEVGNDDLDDGRVESGTDEDDEADDEVRGMVRSAPQAKAPVVQ